MSLFETWMLVSERLASLQSQGEMVDEKEGSRAVYFGKGSAASWGVFAPVGWEGRESRGESFVARVFMGVFAFARR